jgi:hypothetical protein
VLRLSLGCDNSTPYSIIECESFLMILHISSSWVKIRLLTENQLPGLCGSALEMLTGWGGVVGRCGELVVLVQVITLPLPT